MKIELKDGMKVRINPKLSIEHRYSQSLFESMLKYAGKVVTIYSCSGNIFTIKGATRHLFSSDMLVPLIDEKMLALKKSMLK